MSAKGELVYQDERLVGYRFAGNSGEWAGVLEIPVDDVWTWYVVDSDERPEYAALVVAKIVRYFERVGEWPPSAFFQS